MLMKSRNRQYSYGDYTVRLDKNGAVKTIRETGERRNLFKCYAVVVAMGHVGNGQVLPKVVQVMARDEEELKRKIYDMPRVKRDNKNFILSYTEISQTEGKLIKFFTDNDEFFTGRNLNRSTDIIQKQRFTSSAALSAIAKSAEHLKKDTYLNAFNDDSKQDIIQRAYAPQFVENGGENSRSIRIKENDTPLEGKLLYLYLKNQVQNILNRGLEIKSRDKYKVLSLYTKILPKYKKYVLSDENPFKVFYEELEPGNETPVREFEFLRPTNKTQSGWKCIYPKRDLSKTQFSLCYYNNNGKKVSILMPDDELSNMRKFPLKQEVSNYIQTKTFRNPILRTYNLDALCDAVYDLLKNKSIDISQLSETVQITIKELANHFAFCDVNSKQTALKRAEWTYDYDGDYLTEEFYNFKKDSQKISDSEYQAYLNEQRKKTQAKFARFTTPQTQNKNTNFAIEPGSE